MKQLTKTKLISVLFILLLLAASCTEADVTRNDTPKQQPEEVETTFDLKVAPSATPMTRSITLTDKGATEVDTLAVGATASVTDTLQTRAAIELPDEQEKKVANLWIGQYNAAGTTLLSHQYIEAVTGTQVTAKLVVANNCKVRFVANAGNLGAIETETLLDEKTLAYTSTADGRPQSNLFAMTGTWTGDITKETTSLPLPAETPAVMLTRLAAKITFTYKINGEGFTFTPTVVSLKNVPNCSQIGKLTTGVTYGTYSGTVSPTGATIYWYLPENMAGTATGTNTVQSEKEKTGRGVNNATYIELFGNAVQSGVEYKDVAFRFYPGKDENDYNIKRNDHFIMKLDLKGLDISDKRITVGEIPPITESSTGNLPAMAGGTKEVNITSRAGVIWSLPLPVWLSATMNGQITPGGSTLTNQGPGKVTFTTTINQTAEVRSQTYDIKLDDDKSQSFTIAQDASTLAISGETSVSIGAEASTRSFAFTATPGLNWTAGTTDGWISLTGASTGTTPSGAVSVPYSVPLNMTNSVRSGNITVRAGDPSNGPSGTLNITQAGATLAISGETSVSIGAEGGTGSFAFTATPGLNWTAGANADWIYLTGASTGTAPSGTVSVPYQVPVNMTNSVRSGNITLRAGDSSNGPSATLNITQPPIVFDLSANVLNLDYPEVTNSTITLTGSPGLAWTVTPSWETNGITPITTGGTANGSAQAITFHATVNTDPPRTATFTVSSPTIPSLARTITVNQKEGPIVAINQDMLRKYTAFLASQTFPSPNTLTQCPPFDMERDGGQFIRDRHGISFDLNPVPPTMSGSYQIQVESTQWSYWGTYPDKQNYCSSLNVDGHDDWRLPTYIELYAMWDKARGSNKDATDSEPASSIFGAKFYAQYYWNSSVYDSDRSFRGAQHFGMGEISANYTDSFGYVRCVRDL